MNITRCDKVTSWQRVYRAALRTMGFTPKTDKDDQWKARMLLCEHSPIRLLEFDVSVENVKQWITVHLVRHWLGFIPFVHSQRDDRRKLGCPRDELPQGSLNDMDFSVNAQALINISRKRLCTCAHPETRAAWKQVKDAISEQDPVMASKMVRECVYRGFCPEWHNCCGYVQTEAFRKEREEYMKELPDKCWKTLSPTLSLKGKDKNMKITDALLEDLADGRAMIVDTQWLMDHDARLLDNICNYILTHPTYAVQPNVYVEQIRDFVKNEQ